MLLDVAHIFGLKFLNFISSAIGIIVLSEPTGTSWREFMKGNVLVLTVSRIIWSISNSVVFPYVSLYILSLGGSKPTIGLVTAIGNIAGMLLFPLGGYIADKSGRAKLVGYSTILYASSFLFFIFAPSWEWIAVGTAYQMFVQFYMPALNAIMADSIPVKARGRVLALTIAVPEAVRILAPYIGGWLIAEYTLGPAMRIGYTISFVMAGLVAYIRIRYLKETVKSEPIGRDVIKIFRDSYATVFTSTQWVISHMSGFTLVSMLLITFGSLVSPFWVVYGKEVLLINEYAWGTIFLIAGVVKTIFSIIAGSWIDRIGAKKGLIIGLALSIPSMILFPFAQGYYQALAIYISVIIANAIIWISSSVLLANTIPRQMRGRIMAALGQGINIGVTGGGYAAGFIIFIPMTLGSLASGYLYDFNPQLPWLLQSAAIIVGLILTFRLINEPEKAES